VRPRGCTDKCTPTFAAHQDIEDSKMKSFNYARALQAALIGIAITGSATLARADIKDYDFQLVDQTVKKGDAIISVRLIHKPDGKPVPDAVIFATRLDMAPDGMQEMATKVSPTPSTEPGIYKFKATLSMAGGWQLSLGAKVQGETGTVENKLVLKATP
jgi:hypothetical protein